MKRKFKKLSTRTLALFAAAAVMLLGSGGVMGTRAAITSVSNDYDATIALDQLSVDITENGKPAENGTLYTSIGEKVEPTRTYEDSVGVVNDGDADEYVRVIVRKYWTDEDGNKTTELDPDLIELKTAGNDWIEKDGGSDETRVYYYRNILGSGSSAELFESVRISGDVLKEGKGKIVDGVTNGKATKTVITYTYKYDGYTFNVEAEAQAVQTHHAADAIKSVWGVTASMSGDSISDIR